MGECLAYDIRLGELGYICWNAVMEYLKDREAAIPCLRLMFTNERLSRNVE